MALTNVVNKLRKKGAVSVLYKIKNFSYQLKQLKEQGFEAIYEYRNGVLSKLDL